MKVNLVVAAGVHHGKAIPVPGSQLLIGRDPECNLRPASPAVSKKHCLITVRNGSVFVTDLGSTNGTILNDAPLAGEQEVEDGDRIKIGPLDFFVQILRPEVAPDSTPLPETLRPLPPGAGGRLLDGVGMHPVAPPTKAATPAPMAPVPKPVPASVAKVEPKPPLPDRSDDPDALAAALMAEGDDESSGALPVPEGSTQMELSAVDMERVRNGGAEAAGGKKPIPSSADSSNAASEALRKYFQQKQKPQPKKK